MGSLNKWFVHCWCAPYVRKKLTDSLKRFKYALKFSDLELSDNLHAYKTQKGKRTINSFGALRGVEVPEELTDDDLDDDLPYMLMLYTYRKRVRLQFSEQWTEDLSWNILHQKRQRLLACTGNSGYTQNQSEAYAFTLDQMLQFAFNLDGCTLLRQSLNTLKGYSLHFAMQSRSNYKTITPPKNSPKTPKAVWGFRSVVKPLLSVKGRRSRAFHPWHLAKPIHSAKG